ncbi:VOC family protein [Streptomyces sp. DG1A-41]|uniref:VOC family protein n=1 Tax=Streptomyces sp. DG1A-41 TaxID=3125779 RepID=UPI0030D0FD7D
MGQAGLGAERPGGAAAALRAAGAGTEAGTRPDGAGPRVLAGPAGNEFCVLGCG